MSKAKSKEIAAWIERPAEDTWRIAIDGQPSEVEAALGDLAARWGGVLDGQELALMVVAGLRQGVMTTRASWTPARGGTVLSLQHLSSEYRVDRVSTFFLALAAVAGLGTLVLPFFPALWGVLPFLLVILVSAWLFIVARLKSSGVEEFLLELKKSVEAEELDAAAEADKPSPRAPEP